MIEILGWLSKNPYACAGIFTFAGSALTGLFGWLGIRHKTRPEMGKVVIDQATLVNQQVDLIFRVHGETINRLQFALARAEEKVDELTVKLDEAEHKIDILNAQLENGELRRTFQPTKQ